MSASAFIVVPGKIIALSDGLKVDLETHEPIGYDSRKIHKVSGQTLITSAGNIIKNQKGKEVPEIIQEVASMNNIVDPMGTAQLLAEVLKKAPDEAERLNYTVMGFDDTGKPKRIHFTHNCREGKEKPIGVGNVGVMAHECDEKAQKMFEKKLNEKYHAGKGLPLVRASVEAWTETIEHYESGGFLFGGKIYSEVVTSPKQN